MSGLSKALLSRLPQNHQPTYARLAHLLYCLLLAGLLLGCGESTKPLPLENPPRPIPISQEAATRLEERFTEAMRNHTRMDLTLSDEEATSYAVQALQGNGMRELSIWFTPLLAHVQASIDYRGNHTVKAILTLEAPQGILKMHVQRATLDGQKVPRWILASVEAAANDAIADAQSPLWVEEITCGNGTLHLIATRD